MAELCDLSGAQKPIMADGKFAESEGTHADAVELFDRQAHRLTHRAHLTAFPFGNGDLKPALAVSRVDDSDGRGSGLADTEADTDAG